MKILIDFIPLDEELDDDITQLLTEESSIPIMTPSDGEFSSFPEIHKTTV